MITTHEKRPQYNNMYSACPACGSRSRVYTSRPVTTTTREIFFHCGNPDCDATFYALLTVSHYIIPSLIPDGDPRRLPPEESGPRLKASRGRSPRIARPPEKAPSLPPYEPARRRITHE